MGDPKSRCWDAAKKNEASRSVAYEMACNGHFAEVAEGKSGEMSFESIQAEVEYWRTVNNHDLVTCRVASTLGKDGEIIEPKRITRTACEKYRKGTRIDEAGGIGTLKLQACDKCPHCGKVRLNRTPRSFRKRGRGSGTIKGVNPNK